MQRMVGVRMGPGWRQAIDAALGNDLGCTHLREMLFNMATAAYQTMAKGTRHDAASLLDRPPHHVGRCIGWSVDGAVVARYLPQFVGWRKPEKKPASA